MRTLHTTSEYYPITLHKTLTFRWNQTVKRLNLIKLKFVRYLNTNGTVSSSVLGIMTVLANYLLRRILETGENETERYVRRNACWHQVVLGWWDKGWEGEGWDGNRSSEKLGRSFGRGKRREDVGVGGKGWEISTHILIYFFEKVDN